MSLNVNQLTAGQKLAHKKFFKQANFNIFCFKSFGTMLTNEKTEPKALVFANFLSRGLLVDWKCKGVTKCQPTYSPGQKPAYRKSFEQTNFNIFCFKSFGPMLTNEITAPKALVIANFLSMGLLVEWKCRGVTKCQPTYSRTETGI